MFSRPVSSGWKPAPSSRSDATRPLRSDEPARRLHDPPDELEQCRLARPIVPEQSDRLALLDCQRDVLERPERHRRPSSAPATNDPLLERASLLALDREALGDPIDVDGEGHPLDLLGEGPSARSKSLMAMTRSTVAKIPTTARLRRYQSALASAGKISVPLLP